MMKSRLATTLTGLVMSGTLALTMAGTAQAAGGAFVYTDYLNTQQMLIGPTENSCYKIDVVGDVMNGTDAAAELFTDDECKNLATVVTPGGNTVGTFNGAKFLR
jgi:hypothetical protein